ncbi:surface antigen-domain-containing protein [Pelagophyceae sp. CCMP2097]|nr:surface antigen-domain-containing protein [Pelagophyceae sp. CCMP2097]
MEDEPCRVARVVVRGLVRTREYVVEEEFDEVKAATSMGEVVSAAQRGVAGLLGLNLFETVDVSVELDDDAGATKGYTASKLVVSVAEKQIGSLRVGATTTTGGDADVCWEAAGSLRSVLGHGETSKVTYSHSRSAGKGRELQVVVRKPRLLGHPISAEVELDDALRAGAGWGPAAAAAASTRAQGVRLVLSARPALGRVATAKVEVVRRGCDAGAGDVKASARAYASADGRDSDKAPTRGAFVDGALEVAGFGGLGDAAFAKAETSLQAHAPLWNTPAGGVVALSLAARVGAALPLPQILGGYPQNGHANGHAHKHFLHAEDRFYLGGPTSLRGFEVCGVGARDAAAEALEHRPLRPLAALGRLARWLRRLPAAAAAAPQPARRAAGAAAVYSLTAMLTAPAPNAFLAEAGVRPQLWAQVGGLVDAWSKNALAASPRCAVGCGIAWAPSNLARVEVNYAWVLRCDRVCDSTNNFQLGISASFG